jgi:hypothetical protein
MASWPTTLPNPQVNGYSLAPVDETVRTNMEFGAARARRRTSTRNDQLSAAWQMTDAQYTAFRTWFDDSTTGISGGASWFTVTLAIGTTGMQSVTARFVGPFQAAAFGYLNWNVSGKLEIR